MTGKIQWSITCFENETKAYVINFSPKIIIIFFFSLQKNAAMEDVNAYLLAYNYK